MILEVRAVPPFYKNGFVVGCERTREAVVIDPGDEADELLGAVRDHGLDVVHILLTHAHIDHITGVALAKEAFEVPVYLHKDDLPLYEHAVEQGRMFGFTVRQPPPVDVFYDLSPISFGDYEVHVHHTPGHCPGGVCLQVGKKGEAGTHLFVGDTLFAGSIGRTDLPGGNHDVLMRSITGVLFALGDAATVHPGHGPDTTIGRERRTNPFVIEYLSKNTKTS
ncbi:MAG: fold metallo-hydrolase [Acidobacteria bacterium]|nr:fold metallo-hydrolase [Acidobacteriota bacterium]